MSFPSRLCSSLRCFCGRAAESKQGSGHRDQDEVGPHPPLESVDEVVCAAPCFGKLNIRIMPGFAWTHVCLKLAKESWRLDLDMGDISDPQVLEPG